METSLLNYLKQEDPRRPYTDDHLAAQMGIRRERVIELRRQAEIPDSRERLKPVLMRDCVALLQKEPGLSDRMLTARLNGLGFSVSRYLVSEIRKSLPVFKPMENENLNAPPAVSPPPVEDFSNMIGWDGGLRMQINQAKAAVAYPSNGLHTLIIGSSGTGKTLLAENMHQYAVRHGYLPEEAPFVAFNCADYADTPQLLTSQLFGYVKGAFSGANETRDGLVEKANGGILFLDEVHRLPSEGQEQLFFLLDKGTYRRLGDSGTPRRVTIRLIAATTSTPESSLLLTFRRRIPMVISMPELADRALSERFAILRSFFAQEAGKLKRRLTVAPQAVNILLQYPCPGNVGQLRSDIQVCCANAFLESMSAGQEAVYIGEELVATLLHTDPILRKCIRPGGGQFWQELTLTGNELPGQSTPPDQKSIYETIKETLTELQENGMDDEESLRVIRNRMEQQIRLLYGRDGDRAGPQQGDSPLSALVDPRLWGAVQQALEPLKLEFSGIDENLHGALAVHLDSVVRALAAGTYNPKPEQPDFRKNYAREYTAARALLATCSERIGLQLPSSEVAVLAMYLRAFSSGRPDGRVRILVMTHGAVGPAMAEVANQMMRDDNAVGIAMPLECSSDRILTSVVSKVREVDEGKGCVLLVDMGSLAAFAPEIEQRTGVSVRCVARVDTLMVLDAVRRTELSSCTLDELADALEEGRLQAGFSRNDHRTGKPPAILTVCATGEGNARRVRSFLEATIPESNGVHIEELGLMDRQAMLSRMAEIRRDYDVIVVVGTMNPELPGVPFLSMNYVFSGHGTMALTNLLASCGRARVGLSDLLQPELVLCNADFADKNEAIDRMTELLIQAGCVTSEFHLSVYKRENLGITCLPQGIAIPHGDTAFVTKPAVCVAKMSRPVEWAEGLVADFVFLFALNDTCMEAVQIFHQIIEDEKRLHSMKNAVSSAELFKVLAH